MRVLLIAEAANPEWVSVPLVGWSMARAIQQECDAHIVTQVRNKGAFERVGLIENKEFTSIDTEIISGPAWKFAQLLAGKSGTGFTSITAVQSLTYPYFEKKIWEIFKARLRKKEFSLVHRITPLTTTAVSPLAKKCRELGIPFIIGPLNGGLPWPKEYSHLIARERDWLTRLRKLYKLQPGWKSTYDCASRIIVGSSATLQDIPVQQRTKCYLMPENGINPRKFFGKQDYSVSGVLELIFIGRLVPYKGLDLALHAAERLLALNMAKFKVIGDGPEKEGMQDWVRAKGFMEKVTFTGWLDQADVAEHLKLAHILLFPSVREFGGGVVLEAMAAGVIPIVVDYGGPGELVDSAVGFKVPISPREQLIDELSKLLLDLANYRREEIPQLAKNCVERIKREFLWKEKAKKVLRLYADLCPN